MKILYVAYPLLPVSDASAGGAEQVLWTVEREMSRRGHETVVAACEGSRVSGRLFATGAPAVEADRFEERNRQHRAAILQLLVRETFDLVHDHSGSFFASAEEIDAPLLATLHLPRTFYPGIDFDRLAPKIALNCVSASQQRTFADVPNLTGFVRNGIALDRFPLRAAKDDYLLWLGRICEEKGTHLAIEAARKAGRRIIVAGQVYPFSYHQQYFEREVTPLIGKGVEFIESPDGARKIELLAHASALLVPALAEETSSLVALEALACGTPVIAFRRGALDEIVNDGENGFLVGNVEEMAAAVGRVAGIRPEECSNLVEQEYSSERMAGEYERLYERAAQGAHCR